MILFISDIEKQKEHFAKAGFVYLLITLFCAIFGAIYENFSHEVYSGYMIYAFLFPLIGGALPFSSMSLFGCGRGCSRVPGRFPVNLYNAGIATLTMGSIFQGVLDIYGTTNTLICVYWFTGAGFVSIGVLLYLTQILLYRMKQSSSGSHHD